MHLDDERIQRVLHGELAAAERARAQDHLEGCAACRRRIEAAGRDEEEIFALLRRADHAPPSLRPETVAADARGGAPAWGRLAAGVLLALFAAGVAYTAPGSPLPALAHRVGLWLQGPAPDAGPGAPLPEAPRGTAGIAVVPGARFEIRFAEAQTAGAAAVSITEEPEITARVVSGSATFSSADDRLTVENHGSTADYEIEIPRSAPWVEVRVGDRVLLVKHGEAVVTGVAPDARGRYLLSLRGG